MFFHLTLPSTDLVTTTFPLLSPTSQLIKLEFFLCDSLFAGRHRSVCSIGFDSPSIGILFLDVAKGEFQVLAFAFLIAHGQDSNGDSEDANFGDASAGVSENGGWRGIYG